VKGHGRGAIGCREAAGEREAYDNPLDDGMEMRRMRKMGEGRENGDG
jgi:hypothetical protein